jgi:hypothetical protein
MLILKNIIIAAKKPLGFRFCSLLSGATQTGEHLPSKLLVFRGAGAY